MKYTAALVLGAAFGAAHLTISVRQHREKRYLVLAGMHGDLVRDTVADPLLSQITNHGQFADLDDETRAQYMNANRWVSLWSAMFRMEFLPQASMRQVAAEFMRGPVGRDFWELARTHRRITARDKHDERFNDLMNEAHAEVHTEPAAV
ncbi:DUF6082 family protein [Streptomyces nitrosporeus]|uniref:DUF6082 family protein n=1 Tax=Streptomyces nitrosporeus TaxID=28894 RepID=UPI0039A2D09C